MRKDTSGNILFLILIAVALFAALSYTVTQSNRTGVNTISRDKIELAINQTDNQVAQIRSAINRLQLINGCQLTEISMENDVWLTAAGDPIFPAGHNSNNNSDACKLFHPDGGGIAAQLKPAALIPPGFNPSGGAPSNSAPNIHAVSIVDVGSDEDELIIHYLVTRDACQYFNERLGIYSVDNDLTVGMTTFDGTFSGSITIGDEADSIKGREDIAYIPNANANSSNCRINYTLAVR